MEKKALSVCLCGYVRKEVEKKKIMSKEWVETERKCGWGGREIIFSLAIIPRLSP